MGPLVLCSKMYCASVNFAYGFAALRNLQDCKFIVA
jgi:hypothetical protein